MLQDGNLKPMIELAIIILVLSMVTYSAVKSGGVCDSISAISYTVPKWLFSIWIMTVGIVTMAGLMEVLKPNYQWIGFMVAGGISCVASSPYYKEELKTLHYMGAVLCFLSAIASIVILKSVVLLIWLLYPFLVLLKPRLWVLTAECVCIFEIIVTLLLSD